jgi:hypothetical protein
LNLFSEAIHQDDYLYIKRFPLKRNSVDDEVRSVKSHKTSHGFFLHLLALNNWNSFTEHIFQQLCKQSQSNVSNWIFNIQVDLRTISQLPFNFYPKSCLKVVMMKTEIAEGTQLSQFKSPSFLTQSSTRQQQSCPLNSMTIFLLHCSFIIQMKHSPVIMLKCKAKRSPTPTFYKYLNLF